MQLLRNVALVFAAIAVLVVWHNHAAAIRGALQPNSTGSLVSDTLVITYTNAEELISKLRQVKAGEAIDLQYVGGPPKLVSSGIRCSDVVAKAAFMAEGQRQAQEATQAINAELARIQGSAP